MKSILLIAILILTSSLKAQWEFKGPEGGNVITFAVINNNVFALTTVGVYKSMDNGVNWIAANNEGLPSNNLYDMAIMGNILYVASYTGLFTSYNNGDNWTSIAVSPEAFNFSTIATKANVLYAGCGTTGSGGVYISKDSGKTWKMDNKGFDYQQFIDVEHITFNGQYVFVGSNNNGVYSKKINDTIWSYSELEANANIWKFNVLGRSVFASSKAKGVFVTSDYGKFWLKVSPPSSMDISFNVMMVNGSMVYALGTLGFYSSSDTGRSWQMVSDNTSPLFNSGSVSSMFTNGTMMIAGTSIGVLISVDEGKTWKESNSGMQGISTQSIGFKNHTIFAMTGSKIILSNNLGASWDNAIINGKGFPRFFFEINDSLLAGMQWGVWSSRSNGKNWFIKDNALKTRDVLSFSTDGTKIYVGTASGVYSTIDTGKNWLQVNSGFSNKNILSMLSGDSVTLAGTYNDLYKLNSTANSWIAIKKGITGGNVLSLTNIGKTIFAVTDSGIYISENNGSSWNRTKSGLKGLGSSLFRYKNKIFAGTTEGIFSFNGSLKTWEEINTGFPKKINVRRMMVTENYIFAATNRGVWRRPISDLGFSGILPKQNKNTVNIYPNPVNKYLYFSSQVLLEDVLIYDYTGKLILNQGLIENCINIEQLTPGLYFIKAVDMNENLYTAKFIKD